MTDAREDATRPESEALAEGEPAVLHLREAIASGRHWYLALLEAISLWTRAEETHDGRDYRYLIGGEAFDWLVLAERLLDTVNGLVPQSERDALLLRGEPPLALSPDEFRDLIGAPKYHQYLNYFYGIAVEDALVTAVEDEVRKEKRLSGYYRDHDTTNEAYRRIYDSTRTVLLRHFRKEKGLPQTRSISLTELKEFAYWRFKYRLKTSEKARVASDTRKALDWLGRRGPTAYVQQRHRAPETE